MPKIAEIVIVGGGIIGVSVAWHLARRGVREIVVVERSQLAAGATGRSSATIDLFATTMPLARLNAAS